ncbi:TetR/AcrR family transcriptional regulator [Microbacterium sp. CCNWLW134]|uniref:TetR/AcrR family transcriptional regulator n=1 Tax=Microbacterium sp. CCNWLW134 TaxID=3122064 RepID=UPI00300F80AA
MSRPSLAHTRRAEILRAIEECIREVGVAGLTTQQVADRSGYSRGHVRHYLGNKNDQLRALVELYSERYASSLERLVGEVPQSRKREIVLRELFGETWLSADTQDDVVLDYISAYALSHPDAGISLAPLYERVVVVVADALASGTSDEDATTRARTVVALAFGVASMMSLGVMQAKDAQGYAAELLGVAVDATTESAERLT